jgi:hypothetical protein
MYSKSDKLRNMMFDALLSTVESAKRISSKNTLQDLSARQKSRVAGRANQNFGQL